MLEGKKGGYLNIDGALFILISSGGMKVYPESVACSVIVCNTDNRSEVVKNCMN
jgi:hypothetical protein